MRSSSEKHMEFFGFSVSVMQVLYMFLHGIIVVTKNFHAFYDLHPFRRVCLCGCVLTTGRSGWISSVRTRDWPYIAFWRAYVALYYSDLKGPLSTSKCEAIRCGSMMRKARFSARVWEFLLITRENQGHISKHHGNIRNPESKHLIYYFVYSFLSYYRTVVGSSRCCSVHCVGVTLSGGACQTCRNSNGMGTEH